MRQKYNVSEKTLGVLSCPVEAVFSFSDVFHRVADADAELTSSFRNLGVLSDKCYGIGRDLELARYMSVCVDDLIKERRRIIELVLREGYSLNEDRDRLRFLKSMQIPVILNSAPRDGNGTNGKDFYLAVTDNSGVFYSTPTDLLSDLMLRRRITALYRIPNESPVVYSGLSEQFRSSVVTTARYTPEILERVFEYDNRDDLIKDIEAGKLESPISVDNVHSKVSYVDNFGNIRIQVPFSDDLQDEISMSQVVKVCFGDEGIYVIANVVDSLREIPENEFGFYRNVADGEVGRDRAGYFELVKRVANPNDPDGLRAHQELLKLCKDYRKRAVRVIAL